MAASHKKKNKDLGKFLLFCALIFLGFLMGVKRNDLAKLFLNPSSVGVISADEISAKDLKNKLTSKDFVFVNVHTPYEGEIEKTDNFIEYDSVTANQNKLPQDKGAKIILYCKTGRMSAEAVKTLKGLGYTNVTHLKGGMDEWKKASYSLLDLSSLPGKVLPAEGFEIPVSWGDMGPKLVALGAIDKDKFEKAVNATGEQKKILNEGTDSKIKIDASNSQFVVDMLWAYGLAQKSIVYTEGPMGKEYKDKAGSLASTGGWTLAKGDAVSHLNKHDLISLTSDQQTRVGEIAKNVFRPCCGNPTWFPDCNHGMAALAAIELMVYQGLSDEDVYKNVLKLNSFWFQQHYLTLATYFARQGTSWEKIDAKLALSAEYSSGQAAGKFSQSVGPLPYEGFRGGGGCGA